MEIVFYYTNLHHELISYIRTKKEQFFKMLILSVESNVTVLLQLDK